MRIIVNDSAEIDRASWSSFVASHPLGSVFQTPEMYDAYSITKNCSPVVICAQEDNAVVGILVAVIMSNLFPPFSLLTKRSIVTGGPIVKQNSPEIINSILAEYERVVRKRGVIYSQIRPIFPFDFFSAVSVKYGFKRVGHYSLTLCLSESVEGLWGNLHKERRRNIGTAEKNGLEFKEVLSEEGIELIKELISDTYKRKGVPMGQGSLFASAKTKLKSFVHFFGAYYQGRLVGGQVRLCYKDLVYAWYAGSDESYLKLRPNDYLMWKVILWAKDNGFSFFDFGGGGQPGVPYGVRDYKMKYGCIASDIGRWEKLYHPIVYGLCSGAYRLFHKFLGK